MFKPQLHPSKAFRWTQCAAAPKFSIGIEEPPDTDDTARLEGIAAAALISEALRNNRRCEQFAGGILNTTPEMVSYCQEYVDLVLNRDGQVYTEWNLDFYPGVVTPGRLDVAVLKLEKGLLYVDDFKYGHRIVEPTTPQLVIYAQAALEALAAYDATTAFHVNLVQLAIYQPRALHHKGIYRKRVLNIDELAAEAHGIKQVADWCLAPEPVATPGDHCHDCPAASQCEALRHTGYAIGDTIRSKHAVQLTPAELGQQLDYVERTKKMLDALDKGLKTEALARMRKEAIPGWSSATGTGKRRFIYDGPTIQMLTGKNPYVEEKTLVTPAELGRRGASDEMLEKITEKPKTARRLVRAESSKDVFGS